MSNNLAYREKHRLSRQRKRKYTRIHSVTEDRGINLSVLMSFLAHSKAGLAYLLNKEG